MTNWEDKMHQMVFKMLTETYGDKTKTVKFPVTQQLEGGQMIVESDGFGYQVTGTEEIISEKKEQAKRIKTEMYCENCGSTDVEQGYYCTWNVDERRWIGSGDCIEEHTFCSNCEAECSIEERTID